MSIEIKHKITGDILHKIYGETLSGANLSEANLSGTTGNMREIKSLHADIWAVAWTTEVLQIGCQQHSITDWWGFSDSEISAMDTRALDWWKRWKPILQQLIATGVNNVEN